MKKGRALKICGIAIATAMAFGASALAIQQSYEFRLHPNTDLEGHIAVKIEKDNARLGLLLADYREAIVYKRAFDKDLHKKSMEDTYLKNPTLTKEDGTTYVGWDAVLPELEAIIKCSAYLRVENVRVDLEYLPVDSPAYKAKNQGITDEKKHIDIIAHVKTVLVYAPNDPLLTIGGTVEHRRVCDPI